MIPPHKIAVLEIIQGKTTVAEASRPFDLAVGLRRGDAGVARAKKLASLSGKDETEGHGPIGTAGGRV